MMFLGRASVLCCTESKRNGDGDDDGGGDVWCLCLSILVGLARDSIETRDRQGSLETDFVLAPSGLSLVRLL